MFFKKKNLLLRRQEKMRKRYFPCVLAKLSLFSVAGWQKGFWGVWDVLFFFEAM